MSQVSQRPEDTRGQLRGWHVLVALLAFFGVVIGTNATFMYYAVSTFPGEEIKKSYVQGRDFNRVLAERRVQAELGWQAGIVAPTSADGRIIEVTLIDSTGQALDGLAVSATLRRPATDAHDQSVTLTGIGDGLYRSSAVADLTTIAGRWEVTVSAAHPDTPTVAMFEARRAISVGSVMR